MRCHIPNGCQQKHGATKRSDAVGRFDHEASGNRGAGCRGVYRPRRVLCDAVRRRRDPTGGATLGKLATNLRVVRENDGGPIDWSASIIRNVLRLIDGLVLYMV